MTLEEFSERTTSDLHIVKLNIEESGKKTYQHLQERDFKGKENEFEVISFDAVYADLIRVCVE